MGTELIIIGDAPNGYPTPDIGYPIAGVLTMERAMRLVEESKNWPLPWEDGWKQIYCDHATRWFEKNTVRKTTKKGRGKK